MSETYRVLLIEDNPSDRMIIEELLDLAPVSVELDAVATMAAAADILAGSKYDVVLIDLRLPDATGLNAVRMCREKAASTPMIVLTGEEDEALAVETIDSGAQDYLHKRGLETNLLVRAIRYAIGRNNFQEEVQEARQEVLRISDRERMRIGQELHDSLGQKLAAIGFLCKALDRRLGRQGSEEQERAREIESLVNEAISETQDLSRGLYPVMLEQSGLLTTLEELTRQTEALYAIPCRFESALTRATLSSEVSLHLYRIAQEAINNAVKHAAAQLISVEATFVDGRLRIAVRDDGCGFDTDSVPKGRMGLRTMEYRANLIRAELNLRCETGTGSTVAFSLPMDVTDVE